MKDRKAWRAAVHAVTKSQKDLDSVTKQQQWGRDFSAGGLEVWDMKDDSMV